MAIVAHSRESHRREKDGNKVKAYFPIVLDMMKSLTPHLLCAQIQAPHNLRVSPFPHSLAKCAGYKFIIAERFYADRPLFFYIYLLAHSLHYYYGSYQYRTLGAVSGPLLVLLDSYWVPW